MSHFAKECASSTSGDISPTSGDTIWRCIACTFDNSNAMPECEICETKRPGVCKIVYLFKLSTVEMTRYGHTDTYSFHLLKRDEDLWRYDKGFDVHYELQVFPYS